MTWFIQGLESGAFRRFAKSLSGENKVAFRKLFSMSRKHIPAINIANHLLPFETMLLAMLLEQGRRLGELERQLDQKID